MKKMIGFIALIAALTIIGCGDDGKNTEQTDKDTLGQTDKDAVGTDTDTEKSDSDVAASDSWTKHGNLEWSARTPNMMTWQEAKDYCASIGGRLPTINELRSIIINCPGSMTGGACKVSDPDHLSSTDWSEDCYCDGSAASYSALGDGKEDIELWSSSVQSGVPDVAWYVYFDGGGVHYGNEHVNTNVRCVRQ